MRTNKNVLDSVSLVNSQNQLALQLVVTLFVRNATEAIGGIVSKVCRCHRFGRSCALIAGGLSSLAQRIVTESHVFRCNRITAGLAGLNNVGQSSQFVVRVRVLEISGRAQV